MSVPIFNDHGRTESKISGHTGAETGGGEG
jgi:hypothetical protein